MRNSAIKLISVALVAVVTTGCAETLLVGSMVAPTAATGASVLMTAKTTETMATTRWYDGIDRLERDDPAATRYARLQDAAREVEARLGIPVSPVEVEILAKLHEARNADLETFARDRRLTRAQIDTALKTLRAKGLISLMDAPSRPGGFAAVANDRALAIGNPLELVPGNTPPEQPPVYVMNP